MKTICFIGSHKNAGKTTAFNFTYKSLLKEDTRICLSSIGINGEFSDNLSANKKPKIVMNPGTFFLTERGHLKNKLGSFKILRTFNPPIYKKRYILAKCISRFDCLMEGPNEKESVLNIKKQLLSYDFDFFLVDGSINRSFIANPEICDVMNLSVSITDDNKQNQEIHDLLYSTQIPICNLSIKKLLAPYIKDSKNKLIIINADGKLLYSNTEGALQDLSYLDLQLKDQKKVFIYLNGAITNNLISFISQQNIELILENFTLAKTNFKILNNTTTLSLYNQTLLDTIFTKQSSKNIIKFPESTKVINLFKGEDSYAYLG